MTNIARICTGRDYGARGVMDYLLRWFSLTYGRAGSFWDLYWIAVRSSHMALQCAGFYARCLAPRRIWNPYHRPSMRIPPSLDRYLTYTDPRSLAVLTVAIDTVLRGEDSTSSRDGGRFLHVPTAILGILGAGTRPTYSIVLLHYLTSLTVRIGRIPLLVVSPLETPTFKTLLKTLPHAGYSYRRLDSYSRILRQYLKHRKPRKILSNIYMIYPAEYNYTISNLTILGKHYPILYTRDLLIRELEEHTK